MVSLTFLKNDEILQTVDLYTKLNFHNAVCLNFNLRKKKALIFHLLSSYCFSPGISASYQKWRGTKEAQQTYQHYLTGQTVHNCPQHHCSVLDVRNWTGRLIKISIPPRPNS